jgi:hypothetical protein
MGAVSVCFSAPHCADDTAFGKKLFHRIACSVVVQDNAFAQLTVPFSAEAESLSVSLVKTGRDLSIRFMLKCAALFGGPFDYCRDACTNVACCAAEVFASRFSLPL